MSIGNAIKVCRTRRNLTQKELAKRADLNTSYLSQVEQDKRDPTLSTLRSISKGLQIPLSILLFLGGDQDELFSIDKELAEKISYTLLRIIKGAEMDGGQETLL